MQAIETKYLPPGNVRGARLKATCERGSLTIDYPHEFNAEDAHRHVAKLLCAKFVAEDQKRHPDSDPLKNVWNRPFSTGGMKNAYFHVTTDQPDMVALQFASAEDKDTFLKFVTLCRTTEGTPPAMRCGLAASALKKSV